MADVPDPRTSIEVTSLGATQTYGYHVVFRFDGWTLIFNLLEDGVMSRIMSVSPEGVTTALQAQAVP